MSLRNNVETTKNFFSTLKIEMLCRTVFCRGEVCRQCGNAIFNSKCQHNDYIRGVRL